MNDLCQSTLHRETTELFRSVPASFLSVQIAIFKEANNDRITTATTADYF